MAKKYKDSVFFDKEVIIGMDEDMTTQKKIFEKEYHDLLHTADAKKGDAKVIKARVVGMTEVNKKVCAIATFGTNNFKCLIDEEEFMEFPKYDPDKAPYPSEKKMHYVFMNSAIGAEIDLVLCPPYIDKVTKKETQCIDPEEGIARCSRRTAMDRQYKDYWLPKFDGSRVINAGCKVVARVVRVANSCAYMECFGVEFQIPIEELSWNRLSCAQEAFQPGDKATIRILKIKYAEDEEKERPYVVASVKEAEENPQIKAYTQVRKNERYAGEVKNPHKDHYFVRLLMSNAEVYCTLGPNAVRAPFPGDQCTVLVEGMDEDSLRIWGQITSVSEKRISKPKFM